MDNATKQIRATQIKKIKQIHLLKMVFDFESRGPEV